MSYEKLSKAVFSKKPEQLEKLIKEGMDVHTTDKYGRTILSLAAACGYEEMADVLISLNADINKPNTDKLGYTPLIEAARANKPEMIQYLIKKGANIEGVDTRNGTALLHAVIGCYPKIIELLLELGANINTQDNNGNTPIHYLCRYARQWGEGLTQYTIVDGVKKEIVPEVSRYDQHLGTLKLLIKKGADIHIKNSSGLTPLYDAVANRATEFAAELIKAGAKINIKGGNYEVSPLQEACRTGNLSAVKLLLDNKADVNMVDKDHYSPLIWASVAGNLEIVKLLIEKGADPENALTSDWKQYKAGMKAIDVAKMKNHPDIAAFLEK